MARYTGPRRRIVRRLGTRLDGLTRKEAGDRAYPPGQHGRTATRRRLSSYGVRQQEKQKLRYYYGVSEGQLRRYFERAVRQAGPTGTNLLALLERRLDNIVFRLGLAPTIPAARQLVTHGHVDVNGRRVTAPGLEVETGDEIRARERSRRIPLIAQGAESGPSVTMPGYLRRSDDHYGGTITGDPRREDTPIDLQESLVVEFYAR